MKPQRLRMTCVLLRVTRGCVWRAQAWALSARRHNLVLAYGLYKKMEIYVCAARVCVCVCVCVYVVRGRT
jgi:hypothetical protein